MYWQAVCFSKFGGRRAFWGSILEGQNQAKPFMGFSGFFTRTPDINLQNFMSTIGAVFSRIFVVDSVELLGTTQCLFGGRFWKVKTRPNHFWVFWVFDKDLRNKFTEFSEHRRWGFQPYICNRNAYLFNVPPRL